MESYDAALRQASCTVSRRHVRELEAGLENRDLAVTPAAAVVAVVREELSLLFRGEGLSKGRGSKSKKQGKNSSLHRFLILHQKSR